MIRLSYCTHVDADHAAPHVAGVADEQAIEYGALVGNVCHHPTEEPDPDTEYPGHVCAHVDLDGEPWAASFPHLCGDGLTEVADTDEWIAYLTTKIPT